MADEKHIARLLPETREMLGKSRKELIEYVRQDRWLPYPAADRLLGKLEALYEMPDKIRAPSMLIVGDSHCGKSSLVRMFRDIHPPTDGVYEAACPVFYLPSCPAEPDEGMLYEEILKELMIPFRYSDRPSKKFDEVKYQFDQIKVRVIILDEISNALSGSALKQRIFMNAIKNIHNKLQRPIVLVGTQEAHFVAESDKQFKSRFKKEALERWGENQNFQLFLVRLELTLPFEMPSLLAAPDLSRLIYQRAKSGCIGDFVDLISEAAILSINSGKDKITAKEVMECDFTPSSLMQPPEKDGK
jgi:hypothetical protein